ncbi:protein of unknown function [Pararobbsia alpina]
MRLPQVYCELGDQDESDIARSITSPFIKKSDDYTLTNPRQCGHSAMMLSAVTEKVLLRR